MAEKGPPAPTPKPGKTKIPVANQTTKKANISLEPKVIIRPIDYNQAQNTLNPPNQPVHLPEQLPNIPNPPPLPPIPAYVPNEQNLPNQQNQPDQQNLLNQQNPARSTGSTESTKSTKSTKPTQSTKPT